MMNVAAIGASAVAVAAVLWAIRMTETTRRQAAQSARRAQRLEAELSSLQGQLAVTPILAFKLTPWEGDGWRAEFLFGSQRMCDRVRAAAGCARIEDILDVAGDCEAVHLPDLDGAGSLAADGEPEPLRRTRLRAAIQHFLETGKPFSAAVALTDDRVVLVEGRAQGAAPMLFVSDRTAGFNARGLGGGDASGLGAPEALARAPFPAFMAKGSGRLVWVNQAYADAADATPDKAAHAQIWLDSALRETARAVLESGETRIETMTLVVGGKRQAHRVVVFPAPGGVAGAAIDLSRETDAMSALGQQVDSHKEALELLNSGVVIFDADKRVAFHNAAFAEMWGLTAAWLGERPTHGQLLDRLREQGRLAWTDDPVGWKREQMAAYAATSDLPEEDWALPNGKILRVARQRDPSGGLLFLFEDISQEVALRSENATLSRVQRATLDRLSDGVAVFASDGRLRLVNEAYAHLWRVDIDAMSDGMDFSAVAAASSELFADERVLARIKGHLTDPSPDNVDSAHGEISRMDSTILRWRVRPLPDGDAMVVWTDVTAERRVQRALEERNRMMAETDKIKSSFVRHMSRHLREPLTAVLGYAEFLHGTVLKRLTIKQKDQLASIVKAAQELRRLMDNVIEYASIDAGQVEILPEQTDLTQIARAASELARADLEFAGAEIVWNGGAAPIAVEGDPAKLRQAATQLVMFALRQSEEGGPVELGVRNGDNEAQIWVRYSGAGVNSQQLARLFRPFEAVESDAGLGLSIVRKVVELHGGWLEAAAPESERAYVVAHLPKSARMDPIDRAVRDASGADEAAAKDVA